MLLGMLTLLMIQLQSLSRLAIVFCTAPLGIVGASIALNLAHEPFGFVALLGLIALAGMDMRNTVILVDQIETDVRELGMTRREAIVSATVRRAQARRADRARGDPGDDPVVGERLLGADGGDDHGRPRGRDLPDAAVPAGDLRALVPQFAGRAGGAAPRSPPHAVDFATALAFARRIADPRRLDVMFTDWVLASLHHLAVFTLAADVWPPNWRS